MCILTRIDEIAVCDSQSSCEKESSFYIKKCEHTDVASGSRTKRPIAVSNDTTNGVSEAVAIKKSKHASTQTSHTGKSFSYEEREAPATNKSKASTPISAQTTNSSNSDDDYVVTERRNNKLASATTSRARGTRRANVNMRSREIKSKPFFFT
ncbi:hypothetical protein R3W88_013070 [Solanum pinnatisectum]|uniref:Uncharacterized protein n=1 Tax=Solanum pinnatisectum TaxID=50273 RepID=A0AAV9LC01_9SOLN|nr:hypothetical protein R3W88_013070 [Solanum pinnatisectum]